MSTSLNDVVFELYRELQEQKDLAASSPSGLKRLYREPSLLLRYLRYFFTDYGRQCLHTRKIIAQRRSKQNIFTPTQKVYPGTRIAIYTAVTGQYEDIKDPIYIDDDIDYYAFTDAEITYRGGGRVWKKVMLPSSLGTLDSSRKNRYVKLRPWEFLPEEKYDYTIYIDGSFRITCDIKSLVYSLHESGKSIAIHTHANYDSPYDEAAGCYMHKNISYKALKEQMKFYEHEGLPKYTCYFENPVIIRKTNDDELKAVMRTWWEQIERFTHRDQLSLPYALWKNGKDGSYVFSLGNNAFRNPYFLTTKHVKNS